MWYRRCNLSAGGGVEWSSQPCHLYGDRRCLNYSSSWRLPETSLPQETTFSPWMLSFPLHIYSSYLYCKVFGEKNVFSDSTWHPPFPCLPPKSVSHPPTGCVGLVGHGSSAPTCFPPGEAEYLPIFLRVSI